jgi:GTPase
MLITNQHPLNRSIMISLLGTPNVGKSSLINHLLGFDLAAVTRLPQTTRNKYQCKVIRNRTEMIFIDTPGLHYSNKEINKRMNIEAKEGTGNSDFSLILLDLTKDLFEQLDRILGNKSVENINELLTKFWIVFTKSDLVEVETNKINKFINFIDEKYKTAIKTKYFIISTLESTGIKELLKAIEQSAPNAPHLYHEEDVSNKNERFFVTEYIREQAFLSLKEELPYELAVVCDYFHDAYSKPETRQPAMNETRGKSCFKIGASILVNRASQRAIVIGKGGSLIKDIGTRARMKIEKLVGGQVFLNLHVKVSPKWSSNNFVLEEIGLKRPNTTSRVWRSRS